MIRKTTVLLLLLCRMTVYAQEAVEVDTIRCESHDGVEVSVPQIPLEETDSLLMENSIDRYGVVWKDGRCGIYDQQKGENVTLIEYTALWMTFRKEVEGENFTYFGWESSDAKGIIGIAEATNHVMKIAMQKEEE